MYCKQQELVDVIKRSREVQRQRESKAASVQPEEMVTITMKEYSDLKDNKCANVIKQVVRQSKAGSIIATAKGINQVQVIHDFLTKGL